MHIVSPARHYYASKWFPAIRDETDEAVAQTALDRLYGQDRKKNYHIALAPRDRKLYERHLEWFRARVSPGSRVLEAGAGTGTFAAMLTEAGYRVTAADLYLPEDLQYLQRHYSDPGRVAGHPPGIENPPARATRPAPGMPSAKTTSSGLTFSTIRAVENSSQKYDAVISLDVMEHLLYPDRVISGWRDRLAPEGDLFIVCPNYSGPLAALRLAINFFSGRPTWRYQSLRYGLRHCVENFLFNLYLIFTGRPAFVRCMPSIADGRVEMTDSDMDTVHLPSARGLRNYLSKNGFRIISWRHGNTGPAARIAGLLAPGLAPTVRIHARKDDRFTGRNPEGRIIRRDL